jgi:hypothetical protein
LGKWNGDIIYKIKSIVNKMIHLFLMPQLIVNTTSLLVYS